MKREVIVGSARVLVLLFLVSMFPTNIYLGEVSSHSGSVVFGAQSAVDPVDWWPMFHHDLLHTGYSTSTGPITNQTLWSYATNGPVESSPAVVDGIVYVGSNDTYVYALNATTGAYIWSYKTGGPVESSPAVANGTVYVGSDDTYVYALNATTGGPPIWTQQLTLAGRPGGRVSSPAVANGMVYVCSSGDGVYALNASTGAQIWSYTIGAPTLSSPAVVGAYVYVGTDDGITLAFNAITGGLIWSFSTAGGSVYSSCAGAYGYIYVGTGTFAGSPDIYALSAITGPIALWSYTTNTALGPVESSPAIASGIVYVGANDSNVYALNATTGAYIWSYATNGPVESSPAVANGVVYVGSDDDNVYAFGPPSLSVHDVAVTNVTTSKTVVGQGFGLNGTVTAADLGTYAETFNVTVYANTTSIASQNVTLSSGNSTTLTFTWNTTGFAYGNYTISAYAWPVPGETNIANNNFTDGWVIVSIVGDITGPTGYPDGKVDMRDIAVVARAFGSDGPNYLYPGSPPSSNWNPNADINNDGTVNMKDIALVARNFGQHYP